MIGGAARWCLGWQGGKKVRAGKEEDVGRERRCGQGWGRAGVRAEPGATWESKTVPCASKEQRSKTRCGNRPVGFNCTLGNGGINTHKWPFLQGVWLSDAAFKHGPRQRVSCHP